MRWVVGRSTIMAVCIIGTLSSHTPEARPQENQKFSQKLQALVDESIGDSCPGMAMAVLQDGELAGQAVGGVRRIDQPENLATLDDHWHLGSCTKAMTATLIGVLVDEGRLSWDDTIADRLPELTDKIDKAYRQVTLWQLLTHRGGVKANGAAWMAGGVNSHKNRVAIVRFGLRQKPSERTVGQFHYSNLGYLTVALFAENVTGDSWESLIQKRIFEPLKMESAGFGVPDVAGVSDLAAQPWGHRQAESMLPVDQDNPPSMGPAGNVHCSVQDWAKFVAMHLDTDCQRHDLLSADTLKRLHQPFKPSAAQPQEKDRIADLRGLLNMSYAAGWVIGRDEADPKRITLEHNGSNTFWYCSVIATPDTGTAVLIVCNSPLDASMTLVDGLQSRIAKLLE